MTTATLFAQHSLRHALAAGVCLIFTVLAGCGSDPDTEPVTSTEADKGISVHQINETDSLSRADILLVKRMANASTADVKAYMQELVHEEFPADYVIPEYIIRAGDPQAASEAVGKHFPDFYMKRGNDLISMVRKDPLQYRLLILETKALRRHYGKETYK